VLLDQHLRDLAAQRIRLDLLERQDVLTSQIRTIKAEMSERGALLSGMTIARVTDAVRAEARIRAELAWQTVAQVISSRALSIDPSLVDEVKDFVEAQLRAGSPDLEIQLTSAGDLLGRPSASAEPFVASAVERIHSEIDLALAASRDRQQQSGSTTINIYQPFGIIQTGDHAQASFSVSIDDRHAISDALNVVRRALAEAPDLADTIRQESLQVVDETTTELAKPAPNGLKLRAGMSAVATTIQTLGSAGAAYQVLKGAAALVGLQLP
jgi:hypothetical protein